MTSPACYPIVTGLLATSLIRPDEEIQKTGFARHRRATCGWSLWKGIAKVPAPFFRKNGRFCGANDPDFVVNHLDAGRNRLDVGRRRRGFPRKSLHLQHRHNRLPPHEKENQPNPREKRGRCRHSHHPRHRGKVYGHPPPHKAASGGNKKVPAPTPRRAQDKLKRELLLPPPSGQGRYSGGTSRCRRCRRWRCGGGR